ncbi:Serine/threonine-protein phosphatase 2A activator [Trichinella pseudospiralis]|uniref:Serine/threonine-protein phosphatase 2A activator n=1 Tax=Trichinella pseudospiralis TaxID=6337 RepID=A0A0V1JNR1_TRIPS|nr:Serine/threonine-protein phosphatase 2A activator [Trichinella pseudospiralis]
MAVNVEQLFTHGRANQIFYLKKIKEKHKAVPSYSTKGNSTRAQRCSGRHWDAWAENWRLERLESEAFLEKFLSSHYAHATLASFSAFEANQNIVSTLSQCLKCTIGKQKPFDIEKFFKKRQNRKKNFSFDGEERKKKHHHIKVHVHINQSFEVILNWPMKNGFLFNQPHRAYMLFCRSIFLNLASQMSDLENACDFPIHPERKILSPNDMHLWLDSRAYVDYMRFVRELNSSVKGLLMSDCPPANDSVKAILEILKILHSWIDEIPLAPETARFGNKAFRVWQARLEENAEILIGQYILNKPLLVNELKPYLTNSFGNSTRIDYGTGHEVSFLMFLLCLWKVGFFADTCSAVLVLRIFDAYIKLCRRLQMTYKLEPAGSHGAWCLDDYQFCPFLFGSSQLIGNPDFLPRSLCDPDIIHRYSDDYMFMNCILHITNVKAGPFAEHSNGLYSLCTVPNWRNINSGLLRMYEAELS